jgi:hypothetical protein
MKKLLVALVLIAVAAGAFAQDVFTSYNEKGDINIYASVGYVWYIEASVAAEFIVGQFNLGTVPLDWGIAVRGGMEFWGAGVDFGVGGLGTLHLGLGVFPVEFYLSLGVCYNNWSSLPITVASYGGLTWWFSKNIGLLLEGGYLGWGFDGIGLEVEL